MQPQEGKAELNLGMLTKATHSTTHTCMHTLVDAHAHACDIRMQSCMLVLHEHVPLHAQGAIFKKYPRTKHWYAGDNKPHVRFVYLETTVDEKGQVTGAQLVYCLSSLAKRLKGSHKGKVTNKRVLPLEKIKDLRVGKETEPFLQSKAAMGTSADLCFSLVTEETTLDLEATSKEVRDQWIEGLRLLHNRLHGEKPKQASQAAEEATEEQQPHAPATVEESEMHHGSEEEF